MSNPPRAQGTREETALVRAAQNKGLIAERLAEGGPADRGDVRIWAEHEWVVEVKCREKLNIHSALEKAVRKAGTPNTALLWRRLGRKAGNSRRTQVGVPVVALTLDRYLELLRESVDSAVLCEGCRAGTE